MITLPNLFILLCLLLLIRPTESAFVNSYRCSGADLTKHKFTNFLTNSSYDRELGLLSFQFRTFALDTIVDVNDTSNMYTTLHVVLLYEDEVLRDDYLRLCDYAEVDRSTLYELPPGVFYGLNTSASLMPSMPSSALPAIPLAQSITDISSSSSTVSATITTSDQSFSITKTTTGTSSITVDSSASADHKNKTTGNGDPDFLPVAIAKRKGILPFINFKRDDGLETAALPADDLVVVTEVAVSTSVVYENPTSAASSTLASDSSSVPSGKTSGSSCPAYKNNEVTINYAAYVGHRSAFGTYKVELTIIAPSSEHQTIACTNVYANVEINKKIPTYLVAFTATVLGLIFFSNFINTALSPYQDAKDPFLMVTATICNAPLLNQLSPTYFEFLQYLYYVFFMAALNLQYPGFLIPLMTSLRWAGLTSMPHGITAVSQGCVYETIFSGGLKALTLDSHYNKGSSTGNWKDFLWIAAIYIGFHCLFQVSLKAIGEIVRPKEDRPGSWKFLKNCYLVCVGQFYYALLRGITIPFLVYSTFLLTSTGSTFYGSPSNDRQIQVWSVVTTSLALLFYTIIICYFTCRYVLPRRHREQLYQSLNVILVWQSLYTSYDPKKIGFFIIDHLELLLFGIAVGTLQRNGTAQLILIIVSQVIYFCLILLCQPYYSKTRMNRNKILSSLLKVVISVLHIPLIFSLNNTATVRRKVTLAILAFHLIVVALLFLIPTILNLYNCFVQHYKYRKGILGIDIPNYREKGDLIELPMTNTTNDDRGSSILSYSDLFSLSHHRTVHQSHSRVLSVASSENIQLSDQRVLPGVSVSNSYLPNISAVSLGGQPQLRKLQQQSQQQGTRQSLGPPTTRQDWTTREVDLYYNAFRSLLQPDPEVKEFWEQRGRKLYKADMIEQQQKQDPEYEEKNSTGSPSPLVNRIFTKQKVVGFGKSLWRNVQTGGADGYILGKRRQLKEDNLSEPKGFEVMRPRELKVKTNIPPPLPLPISATSLSINKDEPTTMRTKLLVSTTNSLLLGTNGTNRESLYTQTTSSFGKVSPIDEPKSAYLSSNLTTPVDSDQSSNNVKNNKRYTVLEDETENEDTRVPFDFETTAANRNNLYATSISGNTVVGGGKHHRQTSHVSSFFSVGSSSGDWSSFVGGSAGASGGNSGDGKKSGSGLLRVVNDDIGDIDEVESH